MLESLSNKVEGLQACNFIKKKLQHRCFPEKFTQFLKTLLFAEHLRWLLLYDITVFLIFIFSNSASTTVLFDFAKRLHHRCLTESYTAQKMKFSIKDFFSKCDQIGRKLRIWSHLLKRSLMENFIFCAVPNYASKISVFSSQWEEEPRTQHFIWSTCSSIWNKFG